ncbi:hypothetical protein ASPZODRAFT_132505 [Penicilliopsis zonata CBS 506.65]|uniref:AAA+ ATPase domain-containing protein n=1 Tax=Penicilliopsis zonata CBS 506.65 TaxID=1073090 RepID=A0A1L9SGZ3_9EURO|nr:hypothetical protein ASPZODRAFT_132505 [Penicilliopsis zonata CBS 506.65]OJJ46403.1 hypothetical protein ASPZODRAFT_132505 [Penicilliopsis zonata CBS 506.65]
MTRVKICADCLQKTLLPTRRAAGTLRAREWRRCVHLRGRAIPPVPTVPTVPTYPTRSISSGQGISVQKRFASGAAEAVEVAVAGEAVAGASTGGPLHEYNRRVAEGRLRDDSYQRGLIQNLQNLYEALTTYHPPRVVHPSVESLDPKPKSFFGSLFGGGKVQTAAGTAVPADLPKGLYMYGDVGCGKTMLMDLFFDTLPPNITSKSRIHFHNFMQDVHKRMHVMKMKHGNDFDVLPLVAADIAEMSSVLCFDEFQCTDVADAMILRRLLESLMSHGVVLVTTSNRHPDDLYKNGIQRQSFIPCIELLKNDLTVLNLNSPTDYRKIPRPPSGVYHTPLGSDAEQHADKWFAFLGDPNGDPPRPAQQEVWGRTIHVPLASGKAARFSFDQLIGSATGAADYLELVRHYDAFIVTDVPGMDHTQRDLARRFITFIDAVYESRAKLVLTTQVPLTHLFLGDKDVKSSVKDDSDVSDAMRNLMDDLGLSMTALKSTSIFSGDEERFAFARALSRLTEMGSTHWVERGLDLSGTED